MCVRVKFYQLNGLLGSGATMSPPVWPCPWPGSKFSKRLLLSLSYCSLTLSLFLFLSLSLALIDIYTYFVWAIDLISFLLLRNKLCNSN